jgi:deazaflavin-dependent oxidoreductase (nitroreductase family)
MSSQYDQREQMLRQGFKCFNRFMLLLWRLGLGSWVNIWPAVIGRIMVISHKGRSTGLTRHTPVNYAIIDGDIYCTAALGTKSDWYQNLMNDPEVEIWLPNGWWAGLAEDITESQDSVAYFRQILIASGFAARVAGINPHTMPSDKLEQVTKNYHLLKIHRIEPRTGVHGPGDLAWIWPLATMILLPLVFFRRRRQ